MASNTSAAERRRRLRVAGRLKVRFGTTTCDHPAHAENLSETGLYINTNRVLPVGTQLNLQVEFIECAVFRRAQVVWAIRVPEHMQEDMICGMGVEFIGKDAEWQRAFRRWRAALQIEIAS